MMSAGQQQDQYSGQMDGQNSMTLDEPVWHTVVRSGGSSSGVWKGVKGEKRGGLCEWVCPVVGLPPAG